MKGAVLFASDMPFDPEEGPGYIDRTLKAIDSLELPIEEKRLAIVTAQAFFTFFLLLFFVSIGMKVGGSIGSIFKKYGMKFVVTGRPDGY